MRRSRRVALAFLLCVSSISLPVLARECEGVTIPDQVSVDGTKLLLNGMGVREATIFNVNVYVAGLYLQKRSNDGAKIAATEEPKQMLLVFVRDVSKSDMAEAIQKGFTRADFGRLHPGGSLGARLKPVKRLMHGGQGLPLTRADTNMHDVVVEMSAKRLGVIGVTDADGYLVGVITDGDLRRPDGRGRSRGRSGGQFRGPSAGPLGSAARESAQRRLAG